MDKSAQRYSALAQPTLAMSELVCNTLDHDTTDMLIDKWLEHRNDAYCEWFRAVRERRHASNTLRGQVLAWNKGDFAPENIFCRTVDTGRLIPLDRTWSTHVYHHKSMLERKLSMIPVVFTMLPELMLLRGMHDHGCDDVHIIVTDLKRQEMDQVTEYFKLVCRYAYGGRTCKPSIANQIQHDHMRLCHTLLQQRRLPCLPQIDIAFRAILYEKRPPFIILFSHQTTSYSEILFTHPLFVPTEDIFFDFPSGCPSPCCNDDCEMIRFPRRGVERASVLSIKRGGRYGKRIRAKEMCNWIDCGICFSEEILQNAESSEGSEGSQSSADCAETPSTNGLVCSKCRLVKYCSPEHQRKDWDEHRRVCAKPASGTTL